MPRHRTLLAALAMAAGLSFAGTCAAMGLTELPASGAHGPVTIFYPSDAPEQAIERGPRALRLDVAPDAPPHPGNRRLVVISHGSGGAAWVHADLARRLVDAGYVVAVPEHRADNWHDDSDAGPDSWARRPAEVSQAIDAVAADPRFAPLLSADKVGVYGVSAGGHAALTLAGGRWSRAGFKAHCDADLVADFASCVGLATELTGSWLDGARQWLARRIIDARFADPAPIGYVDPRVAAVVAAVPAAADFDMGSLAAPRVPLGIITAGADRWLVPRFHSDRVLQACRPCERLVALPGAGHGAALSPLPPHLPGLLGRLLDDPPGFDRADATRRIDDAVAAFFERHLPPPVPALAPTGAAVAERAARPTVSPSQ